MIDVVISMPLHEYVKFKTTLALLEMQDHTVQSGYKVRRLWSQTSLLNEARQQMADHVIENKASYLFFVDSDMTFPKDALARLMKHNVDIVSGLCFAKKPAFKPIAGIRNKEGAYDPIDDWPRDQLFEVDTVGCGFLLIKREVLEKIQWPHFAEKLDIKKKARMGEDYYFCQKAKVAGFSIMVDPTLDIRHIGDYEYGEKDYLKFKKMAQILEEKNDIGSVCRQTDKAPAL